MGLQLNATRSASVQYNMSVITDYMLVGGKESVDDRAALDHCKVTHVVNCTEDIPCYFEHDPDRPIAYYTLPVGDNPEADLTRHFDAAFSFMEACRATPGGRCLVHCHMGMSRSTAVAMAYLMCKQNMALIDAYALLKRQRPVVSPNVGFMGQLCALEERLSGGRPATLDLAIYGQDRFADVNLLRVQGGGQGGHGHGQVPAASMPMSPQAEASVAGCLAAEAEAEAEAPMSLPGACGSPGSAEEEE